MLTRPTGFHQDLFHSRPWKRWGTDKRASFKHYLRFFLYPETVAALQAFRKRHADAQRIHSQLSSQPATVDLAHYRSILKNKAIVDDAEKLLNGFKPVTYDVNTHVKAIETFEAKAVGAFVSCTLPSAHSSPRFLVPRRQKQKSTRSSRNSRPLLLTSRRLVPSRT